MILAAILSIAYYILLLLGGIFLLAPDVSLSSDILDAIHNGTAYAMTLDAVLPIHELLLVICSIFLAYEAAYLTLKLFNFIIRKIPGLN